MIEISEILYRWSKNLKIKTICKSLGYARNSVRKVIKEAQNYGLRQNHQPEEIDAIVVKMKEKKEINTDLSKIVSSSIFTKLNSYDERITAWLLEKSMTITQIRRLIKESGFEVSDTSLRRYLKHKFCDLLNPGKKYTMPLFSDPGEEVQVDYGFVGLMKDSKTGKMRKTYAFVMVLANSRHRYVDFSFSQDVKSWVQSHINAFKFFGGVPKTILLDNLKSGIIKANIYDPTINRTYGELERFYGFVADPAKVRTPEHKGKVERSVLIVKQQLIAGRVYDDINYANESALHWCSNIIAHKITRTTGKTPAELFTIEQPLLLKLPAGNFDISIWGNALVHKDHHLVFMGNFYSVPTCYIGLEVSIRAGFNTLDIYYDSKLIKSHIKLSGKGNWQTDKNDYPIGALKFLEKTPEKCLEEAKDIGEGTLEIVKTILLRRSKQRLRKVQAILRLEDKYGKDRLENACLKAFIYENFTYEGIRNCLEKNLENINPEIIPTTKAANDDNAYLRPASHYKSSMEAHYGR
jgi:transposase